jgi:hypothetical protein
MEWTLNIHQNAMRQSSGRNGLPPTISAPVSTPGADPMKINYYVKALAAASAVGAGSYAAVTNADVNFLARDFGSNADSLLKAVAPLLFGFTPIGKSAPKPLTGTECRFKGLIDRCGSLRD